MVRCTRCCLYHSMKTFNLIVNFCGVGMIIYSLWLLKMWKEGFIDLGSASALPRPWFIYTCLAVGILVCLSMISGHMVYNSINPSILTIYILFVFSILILQGGLIIAIFFKINWEAEISKYIDGKREEFQNFLIIHLIVCRSIAITVLAAQVSAIMLAVILWVMGPQPMDHCSSSDPKPELKQSFLVRSDSHFEV